MEFPNAGSLRRPHYPTPASATQETLLHAVMEAEFATKPHSLHQNHKELTMAPTRKGHPTTPNTDSDVEEARRSGYTDVENYENKHNEATELTGMARDETFDPFDTAEGLLRLMAAIYLASGRGRVRTPNHKVQKMYRLILRLARWTLC